MMQNGVKDLRLNKHLVQGHSLRSMAGPQTQDRWPGPGVHFHSRRDAGPRPDAARCTLPTQAKTNKKIGTCSVRLRWA